MTKREEYVTVSLPKSLVSKIDVLIERLGYWPSRASFVREACLEKIDESLKRIKKLDEIEEGREGV